MTNTPKEETAEPVAWRWKWEGTVSWNLSLIRPYPTDKTDIEPLFTAGVSSLPHQTDQKTHTSAESAKTSDNLALSDIMERAMICSECKHEASMLIGKPGLCFDCNEPKRVAWQEKMAIRQDPAQFDPRKLVNLLLDQHWMHECKIIPDYMPPHPREDTRPTCQVKYVYEDGTDTGLRYSKGPFQGYFWDSYGDDFHSPELALVALSRSPPPPRVKVVIPTHGK